ncbi:MAG: hypothetical protein V8T87_06220 [Victivallales bacterium]
MGRKMSVFTIITFAGMGATVTIPTVCRRFSHRRADWSNGLSRKFFILDSSKEYVNPRTMTAIASAGASLSYSVNGNYHNSGANAIYLDGHVERNKDFYFKRSKALWTMNYY